MEPCPPVERATAEGFESGTTTWPNCSARSPPLVVITLLDSGAREAHTDRPEELRNPRPESGDPPGARNAAAPAGNRGERGSDQRQGSSKSGSSVTAATDVADVSPMSRADRANLERLARKRAKLATAQLGERVKTLKAEVEDQLSAIYEFSDDLWADINAAAQAAVASADAQVAEACRRAGIPDAFRPRLALNWAGRGQNAVPARRAELRKLAYARIDEGAETAKVTIASSLLEVETELISGGLESGEAAAFIRAMPTADELLAPVDVGELEPGGGAQRHWEPAPAVVSELLTPSTAATREAKRRAVVAALAAAPAASNRQIARAAGVDHKTVGKLRAAVGETPHAGGDFPADSPGSPAADAPGGAR